MLALIPYLSTLFTPHTTILSLLSITSLLSTAYLLFSLPPGETGLSFLDPRSSSLLQSRKERLELQSQGPIRTYLPYLNLGICVVLVVLGLVMSRKTETWGLLGGLPGVVYGVVLVAKWVMGSVDPEGELGGLRYGFKGA